MKSEEVRGRVGFLLFFVFDVKNVIATGSGCIVLSYITKTASVVPRVLYVMNGLGFAS